MPEPDSKRPQERDFNIDQWEKFPFAGKEDPYGNRSDERKEDGGQSQYNYEGWEHKAFPNKNVSEQPAESEQPAGEDAPTDQSGTKAPNRG